MRALILEVKALQASFRRPLDLNYQRTLPLPPPTTMLGLAGAALGLSDVDIWNSEKGEKLRRMKLAALINGAPGKATDMMTVLKIKGNKIEQRSPYFREIIFDASYTLIYSGDDEFLEKLRDAFYNPFFPLSLGREEDLIELLDARIEELEKDDIAVFYGTAFPGDIREMEFSLPDFKDSRSPVKVEPAIVENVPITFSVEKGQRIPREKRTLTFLPFTLKVELKQFAGEIFRLGDRRFTWMNY